FAISDFVHIAKFPKRLKVTEKIERPFLRAGNRRKHAAPDLRCLGSAQRLPVNAFDFDQFDAYRLDVRTEVHGLGFENDHDALRYSISAPGTSPAMSSALRCGKRC